MIDINNVIKCALIHANIRNFDKTVEQFGMPHYHRMLGTLGVRSGKCRHISDFIPNTYWIIGSDYPIFDSLTREFLYEYRTSRQAD